MARIAGVDLPANKRIDVALTYIFGIGPSRSKKIIEQTQVDPATRVKDLTETQVNLFVNAVNEIGKIEGDLRREITMHIKRLMDIGCYRGIRHRKGLPCRGQRTKTNARTRKGKKKTVGRGKKK